MTEELYALSENKKNQIEALLREPKPLNMNASFPDMGRHLSWVKFTGSDLGKVSIYDSSTDSFTDLEDDVNLLVPNNEALIEDTRYLAMLVGLDDNGIANYMITASDRCGIVKVTENYDSDYWLGERMEFVTAGSWESLGEVYLREPNGRQLFTNRYYLAIATDVKIDDKRIWLCVADPVEIVKCGAPNGTYYDGQLVIPSPPTDYTEIGGDLGAVLLSEVNGKPLVADNYYIGVNAGWYNLQPFYVTEAGDDGISLTMPSEFSVTGSPAIDGDTLAVSWTNETGNTVLASPADGSSGTPTFRALVSADVSGLSGAGSVSSVALTAPSEISVSGSPVTGTGTLALTWANQTAGKVFASPSGSTGTPTFRAIADTDLPGSLSGGFDGDLIVGLVIGGNPSWGTFPAPLAAGYYLASHVTTGLPVWYYLDGSRVNLLNGQLNIPDWQGATPTTLNAALNRMSTALVGLLGNPIP